MLQITKIKLTLLILSAFAILMCSASVQAQEIVHVFGNWRIEKVTENNSYILVGIGDVSDPQKKYLGLKYFNIQCFLEEAQISLMIPYDIKEPDDLKFTKLLFWSDDNEPTEIKIFRSKSLLVNISEPDNKEDDVLKLVNSLQKSSERFSFSFGGKSISFDTKDFLPAWSTLSKLCNSSIPASGVRPTPGGMTEKQNIILRQVMSVGGQISKQMHDDFWADVSKDIHGEWDPIFIWLLENIELAQTYQKELWKSALQSYEQRKIIKTPELQEITQKLSNHAYKEAPFDIGTEAYEGFMDSYAAQRGNSDENARRLLEAAANRENLISVSGETVEINDITIRVTLDGMNAGFERLKKLMNPIWE